MNWILDCPFVIWNKKTTISCTSFEPMFMLLTGCSKQCKKCWDVALIFHFKYFEQIMRLSEMGGRIYFYEAKEQIVWCWPYVYPFNPVYWVIKIFFTGYGQVWFFKKDFKRKNKCSKTPNFFYHV